MATNTITAGSPISQLIGQLGNLLVPTPPPTQSLTYDTYAAPQREAFNIWKDTFRKQYDYTTVNPFKANYANNAAAGGSWMYGKAPKVYQQQSSGIERNYQDQLANAQNTYEDMLRQGYNQRIQQLGNSPIQNLKI